MLGLDERKQLFNQLGMKQWYARFKFKSAKHYRHTSSASLEVQVADRVIPEIPASIGFDDEKYVRSDVDFKSIGLASFEADTSVSRELIFSEIQQDIGALDICLVDINSGVLVLFEKRDDVQLDLQMSLLKSIFQSVKVYDELALSEASFQWPVFKAAVLQNNQQLSFDGVFLRWISDISWPSYKYVFYFGHHFDQIKHLLSELKAESRSECLFMHIDIMLSDIISVPSKKRAIWERLSKLDWFYG